MFTALKTIITRSTQRKNNFNMKKSTLTTLIAAPIVLLCAILILFKITERVDNGNVGIRYSMAGGVRDKALSQGVHFVGLDYVTQYPIKTQSLKQDVSLATGDGKKTDVTISYSYHVDPSQAVNIYKKFGSADINVIQQGWLAQKLQKAGRAAMSKYTLLEVVGTDSTKVQAAILKEFSNSVEKNGFVIEDLSFGTPSIDEQTQKSIDDIIKAGQDNKKAELEAKTKQTQADADAKAQITKANAEATANKKINDSVTDTTIAYMEAQARQKFGWVTTQTGQAIPK